MYEMYYVFFFKQKTAYEMRISDWSSYVCSSDLGAKVTLTHDAAEAARGADVVVTDTWISMGQSHADEKLKAMMPFQVNEALMGLAKPDAKFIHCLPAHRGEEVVDAVLDGPQSVIWDEEENRLHAQKSVLRWSIGRLGWEFLI